MFELTKCMPSSLFQYTGVIFLVVPILTKLTGYLPTTHPTPPTHRTLPSSHYHYYHTLTTHPTPPTHRTLPSSHYHYYHPPHTHLTLTTHPTPPPHRSPPPRLYKFLFKRSETPPNVYRRNVRTAANQISPIESVRSSAQRMTLLRLLVT